MNKIIKIQNRLVEAQIELSKIIEEKEKENLTKEDIDYNLRHEVIEGVLRVIIPEYPPKVSVYFRNELVNGSLNSTAYQKTRNRRYSIIHKALEDYEGERIDPAIVYMIFYVPRICDTDNFIGKMIVDGLMYAGAIAKDDNLKHVPVEVKEVRIDKENPRTEIHVIKHINQVEKILTPWVEEERKWIEKNREKSRVNLQF